MVTSFEALSYLHKYISIKPLGLLPYDEVIDVETTQRCVIQNRGFAVMPVVTLTYMCR